MQVTAIHILGNDQRSAKTINFESQSLSFDGKSYNYPILKFEIGGNNDSILFIHLTETELLYISLDRTIKSKLRKIELLQAELIPLFRASDSTALKDASYIAVFIAVVIILIYFRGPIAGSLSTLVPVSLERKIGDKIFQKNESDEFDSVNLAEKKLQKLLARIKGYSEKKILSIFHPKRK